MEKNGGMRGAPDPQLAMLTSLSTEDLIPADHPIREIRAVVEEVLAELDDVFRPLYTAGGRRTVPPETLLKATVLMAMYSIRSKRRFANDSTTTCCSSDVCPAVGRAPWGMRMVLPLADVATIWCFELVFKCDAGGPVGHPGVLLRARV